MPPTANAQGRACTARLSRYQPVSRSGRTRRGRNLRLNGFRSCPNSPATSTITATGTAPATSGSMPAPKPKRATLSSTAATMPRTRVVVIRSPSRAMNDGSSVTEPTMTTATVAAAATPKPVTNGIPMNSIPNSDTTTVAPANMTDRPAESRATTRASSRPWPSLRASR